MPKRRGPQKVQIFISHAHSERDLAEAWKQLITAVSLDNVEVWYSADPREGIRPGERWRESIDAKLMRSTYVIALQSPGSLGRPWILWECGMAKARKCKIVLMS